MKMTVDGREYPFPLDMDMGELRLLKRHFDMPRPSEMDYRNVDHQAGWIFIALKRAEPRLGIDALIDRVDAVKKLELELEEGDDGFEADGDAGPTTEPADTAKVVKAGK